MRPIVTWWVKRACLRKLEHWCNGNESISDFVCVRVRALSRVVPRRTSMDLADSSSQGATERLRR